VIRTIPQGATGVRKDHAPTESFPGGLNGVTRFRRRRIRQAGATGRSERRRRQGRQYRFERARLRPAGQEAIGSVIDAGHKSDGQAQAMAAGKSNLVDVATAVTETEVAIESLVSVRDKVIQAYEEIMRMPI